MLEELLDNSRLWNADVMGVNLGLRITAPKRFSPAWLDSRIHDISSYEDIDYEILEHKDGRFNVPVLRMRGREPRKNVLLQAIHASEWAAVESVMRFADDWGRGEIQPEIKDMYNITAIPLLSIDKFPKYYGSGNMKQDERFETISREMDSADIIIEAHETGMKNTHTLLMPITYFLSGLGTACSYFYSNKESAEKYRKELRSAVDGLRKAFNPDIWMRYSECSIPRPISVPDSIEVKEGVSAASYVRRKAKIDGKPAYGIELLSDQGEIGESYLLRLSGMLAYPLTELSTFLNRTFRGEQIRQSRLRAAENGRIVIEAVLAEYL